MIKLDRSVLLGNGAADQARGAKIGDKTWAPPSSVADKVIQLDRGIILDRGNRTGAAKIGAKDESPPKA